MRASVRIPALMSLLFLVAACVDLDVENPNDPDRERALARPSNVETLISGSFRGWWYVQYRTHDWYPDPTSPSLALSVMSDQHSSSHGNSMMNDSSQEPRKEIRNDQLYDHSWVVEKPWSTSYSVLAAARDGLIALDGGLRIGEGGADTQRARAFAKLIQGLSHGDLALIYDQAFIVDENTDLEMLERVPYGQVRDAAIGYLNEAIDIAMNNSFTIPDAWVPVGGMDETEFIKLAHTFIARYMAYTPRSVAEREAVVWSEVLSHVNAGITEDFTPYMDNEVFFSDYHHQAQRPGWARIDLRMLGPADQKGSGDPDGSWVEWEATQPGLRDPFPIDADDLRLPDYPPVEVANSWDCYGLPRDNSCGGQGLRMMMEYHDTECCFKPERGKYHFSGYVAYMVYDYWMGYLTGPIVAISKFEMDMLAAEAFIRMGQESNAWPLIDATRVDYGGLTSVAGLSATDPVVEDSPGRCTPHVLRDASGKTDYMNGTWQCGDLWEAMKYEKRMETYVTSMGVSYFDDRGWGDLLPGTATMFPVPAKELLVLLEEIYTFGGDCTQVGSAPCDIVDWGDGGLKPLQPGDIVTEEDMRARVELFNRIFSSGSRSHPTDAGRR